MDNIYKVVVCGADNTGKASSVERLVSEDFTQNYNPILGVDFHPIYFFHTDKGPIQFNAWDCAGSDEWKRLGKGYSIKAD